MRVEAFLEKSFSEAMTPLGRSFHTWYLLVSMLNAERKRSDNARGVAAPATSNNTWQVPWKSRAAEECRTGQPHCYRRSPLIEACPTIPQLQNSTHQCLSMAKALQVSDPHWGNWTCAGSSIFIDLSCNMEAQANVQRNVCNSAVM